MCLFAVGVVCEVSVREPHDREIDVWGDVLCVWERYTLHSACAWEREMPGDLDSGGRDVCMPER